MTKNYQIVVVGVSAGGLDALSTLIPALTTSFPLPVVVVQHRRPDSDDFLATHLDSISPLAVREAQDKEPIRPSTVYVAPGNYHLLIERDRTLSLSIDERVNHCRPSIDVLFESAADVYGDKTIGVILTGANDDGSHGLGCIRQRGGLAVVQDPDSAASECMPREAIRAVDVDQVLPLGEIGPCLMRCWSNIELRASRMPSGKES